MPLMRGKSKVAIEANIRRLIREGFPQETAVAIALQRAGKMPKKKKTKPRTRRQFV